jgi:cell division protease FtsH
MFKERKISVFLMFFVFALAVWIQYQWIQSANVQAISYSEFETLLKANQVDNLVVTDKYIRGEFTSDRPDKKKRFLTVRVEPELARDLIGTGVKFTREVESTFLRDVLSWIVPALVFLAFWMFLSRRLLERGGMGGVMAVSKSRAKLYVETDIKTTFQDVAGIDEAKEELHEVVEFLKDPIAYGRLGARMPKGILLVGPPGTGKTLLAKAVAGEAQVPFFSISGSEFVELFVGVGAARVRDLFQQARQQAPCIIFIDELDALGKMRAPGIISGGHDEKEQTLNQLLAELDGFDTKSGVVLLAATNRPEILDPALLRAGRFDRQVLVDRPDKLGREAILKVHLKKIKAPGKIDIEHIAGLTPGFTGADLANLVNEAALSATRRNAESVDEEDFVVAIERIVAGLEKKTRILSPKERAIVAYHEMGHALVACLLPGTDKVQKISIIPRGIGALGYTMQRPIEDRYLMTKQELLNKMSVLMGGRMAEVLIFGETSTGAADDLVKVTNIAEAVVSRYGMSSLIGNIVFEKPSTSFLEGPMVNPLQRTYSEESAKSIDSEMKKVIETAANRARGLLELNRDILDRGARLLLEKETLGEPDIKNLMVNTKMPFEGQEISWNLC